MSRVHSRLARLVAAAVPLAAACSSSATDPAAPQATPALSAAEVGTLASFVASQAKTAAATSFTSSFNSDGSFTFSSACPFGGTVAGVLVAAPFASGAAVPTFGTTLTLTPHTCGVTTGARTIFISGDPAEVVQSSTVIAGTRMVSSTSTVTGGFKWDGGSCPLNYTTTSKLNGLSDTVTVVGTVCGQRVNVTRGF